MQLQKTKIPGCFQISPKKMADQRGVFVKTFNSDAFCSEGLACDWKEQYYTVSRKGVIRGFHFQLPPYDHAKLIYCVSGSVEDFILDLRVGSPTYREVIAITLSAALGNMVYIPKGLAHGFCTSKEDATLVYNVSSVRQEEAEAGIRWNTAGIEWPISSPIISERDTRLVSLASFRSPFLFENPYCIVSDV